MKKVLSKRIFASTLAGTLALSLPLTAMAASAGGEGGTEGDANVVAGKDTFFSIILPTNTASNVDFTIDPKGFLSSGDISGISKEEYQKGTRLYFSRVNYAELQMGERKAPKDHADYYWGQVENASGGFKYGNTSNWMTVTNRSSKPVTVELKVDWSNTSQVEIVHSEDELDDSKNAAIFMQVEGSEGRTADAYTGGYKGSAWKYDFASTAYEKDGKETTVSATRVGKDHLKRAYKPTEDPEVLAIRDMPAVTDADTSTYVTWVIPTINQTYLSEHTNDEVAYRTIDKVIDGVITEPLHQAYYLRAYYLSKPNPVDKRHEVSGVELWNNRNETYQSSKKGAYAYQTDKVEGVVVNSNTIAPFDTPDNKFVSYDESINMYPTYGFRLNGEANTVGWDKVTEMPKISLSWKVTIGEPNEEYISARNPKVWDGISDVMTDQNIDIKGIIDDKNYYRVLTDGTKLTSVDVEAGDYKKTVWDSVNGSEQVDTTGFINAGVLDMVRVIDVKNDVPSLATEGNSHEYRFYINEIMLLNYSRAKFFVKTVDDEGNEVDKVVTLKFNFTDPDNNKTITIPVVLKDSMNSVNEGQD